MKVIQSAIGIVLIGFTLNTQADLINQLIGGGITGPGSGGSSSGGNTSNGDGGGAPGNTAGNGEAGFTIPENAVYELEPNDSQDQANVLQIGVPQAGEMMAEDEDWYVFQVDRSDALVQVEIQEGSNVSLILQDKSGETLATFKGDPSVTRRYVVTPPNPGEYILKVTGEGMYVFTVSGDGVSTYTGVVNQEPTEQNFFDSFPNALFELEPNDSQGQATPFQPGNTYVGDFKDSSDVDWFHFQNMDPAVSVTATIEIPNVAGWKLELQDGSGKVLSEFTARADRSQRYQIILPAGTKDYFLITRPDGGQYYAFSLSGDGLSAPVISRYELLHAQAVREAEPNSHILSANPIGTDLPVAGQLYAADDQDWFGFQVTQPNTTIEVDVPAGPASWKIEIRDTAGNVLESKTSLTDQDLLFSTFLEKSGKYYLVVSAVDDARDDYVFKLSGEGVQNPDDRNPKANFYNVEIERNDTLAQAYPLSSAVRLRGQLMTLGDVDVYRLESPGDEILSLELCPGNAPCAAQKSWAVYVLDGAKVDQEMLEQTVLLQMTIPSAEAVCTTMTYPVNHLYLLYDQGLLDDALLGVIDPEFGDSRRLDVGLKNPGTYYVVLSTVLKRDADGSVILRKGSEIPNCKLKDQYVVVFPYSDDLYEFQMVQTRLTPLLQDQNAQSVLSARVDSDVLEIPVVAYQGQEYAVKLKRVDGEGPMRFALAEAKALAEGQNGADDLTGLKRQMLRASVSGETLHIPMARYQGHVYTGDMRMFQQGEQLLFELLWARPLD